MSRLRADASPRQAGVGLLLWLLVVCGAPTACVAAEEAATAEAAALREEAAALYKRGDLPGALEAYTRLAELGEADASLRALGLSQAGLIHKLQFDLPGSRAAYKRLLAMKDAPEVYRKGAAEMLKQLGRGDVLEVLPPREGRRPAGTVIAETRRPTLVFVSLAAGETGKAAADEFERCLSAACGADIRVREGLPAERDPDSLTVVLAAAGDAEALSRMGVTFKAGDLPREGCLVAPLPEGRGLALVSRSPVGLLYGATTVLEDAVGALWATPRSYFGNRFPKTFALEITVHRTSRAVWTGGRHIDRPALTDRGALLHVNTVSAPLVDWCARNKLNLLAVYLGGKLPVNRSRALRLQALVERAHGYGIKVIGYGMTHRVPADIKEPPPASAPATIALSTKLYAEEFERFGFDGMGWHSASENITVGMDDAYKKRSRLEWEATYFRSYYKAIRAKHPDAVMAMLMGWVWMNPAPAMAELFPADTVAHVVPNTPIIDAAKTDLDAYTKHFKRAWYWLYVGVSKDGDFPMVKCDYLEKYAREAVKRGHGLMPQWGYTAANSMYLAHVAWHGVVDDEEFLRNFGCRYYGDPRMGDVLVGYQEALKRHRDWTNNIHTRDRNYRNCRDARLAPAEITALRTAARAALDVARATESGLVRERLRELAVTAIRCLSRRDADEKDRVESGAGRPVTRDELRALVVEAGEVFSVPFYDAEKDRFGGVLLDLARELSEDNAE